MRLLIATILVGTLTTVTFADGNSARLFGNRVGVFVAPGWQSTEAENRYGEKVMIESWSARGGVVINSRTALGAYYERSFDMDVPFTYQGGITTDFVPTGRYQVMGVTIQYFEDRLRPRSPLSLRGELAVGAGQHRSVRNDDPIGATSSYTKDNFVVYEAMLHPQLKLIKPIYISFGFGYRFVQGFTQGSAENSMLSGLRTSAALTIWSPHI